VPGLLLFLSDHRRHQARPGPYRQAFGTSEAEAERRFCTTKHGHKRIMRRKRDVHFRRICRFFDTEARRCGIYEARPAACRAFPGRSRCGYYDFLTFERDAQKDADYVSTTWHAED
jgi:uncharacterized protein